MDIVERTYSIKEVALLTGLPASTLRYYETVGVIPPVRRGDSSGHRVYGQADLDLASWVSCLAGAGMSVDKLRDYVHNGRPGQEQAAAQIDLLEEHAARLEREAQRLAVRRDYVQLKISFWRALQEGDEELARQLGEQASALGRQLHEPSE